jgi:PleD family two-component response regulator
MTTFFNNQNNRVHITLSIGLVAGWPDCAYRLLFSQSDLALYKAKDNGRNQVVIPDIAE